jgi:hypothetical protein
LIAGKVQDLFYSWLKEDEMIREFFKWLKSFSLHKSVPQTPTFNLPKIVIPPLKQSKVEVKRNIPSSANISNEGIG